MSTNGMSAAQLLQQAHDKPLTEDPFPVDKALFASNGAKEEGEAAPASSSAQSTSWQPKKAQQQPANVNLDDDQAFPSLSTAAPASNKGSTSKWGQQSTSALRSRLAASEPASQQSGQPSRGTSVAGDEAPLRSSLATLTVSIPTSDVHIPAPSSTQQQPRQKGTFSNERHSEPTSLGDVMKLLMKKYSNVTIEASTSRQLTNFILKAKGTQKVSADDLLEQVRRELLGRLSKKVSIQLPVPTSLRAVIIGSKGRNLKQIIEETGANIQIPNKEASEDEQSPKPQVDEDDEVGPMVAITISGPSSSVSLARERIMAIVADRTSKTSVKLDNIPTELWPLLNGAKGARMNELLESVQASELVNVFVPRLHDRRGVSVTDDAEEEHEEKEAKAITLSGDKDAINRVVEAIESRVEDLKRNSKTLSINVNKRQHRFLVGQNAEEVLEATGCCVILPPAESPSEEVFIRGPSEMLPQALGLVMAKANAQPVESLDLLSAHRGNHDKRAYAAQLTRYVLRRSKFRPISEQNGVQIYMPRPAALESGSPAIEIVGKSAESLAKARQAIIELVRGLPPSNFSVVEIDSLVHKHLIGKKGSKIKTFEDKHSVETVFPADGEDRPDILIVYAGEPANAKATLDAAKQELESLAKDAADLTTVTLTIPSILHRSIIGQGGTTLNAILGVGDERLAHVSFGSSATSSTSKGAGATNGSAKGKEDEISIRGPSEEVERVKQEIERIAEQAKNDEIVNSHTVEFEVERSVVRHIVGKQGSGINKLREDLGVKVDIEELAATSTSSSKQKPDAGLKSKVTIRGRKENVEEAKRRVSQQAEKLADETTLTIPLPDSLERGALIGKQGTYLKRLENSYEVRINFPRDSRKADDDEDDEPQRSNEITIRGPKKGAEQARKELVDLIDYEREHGHTASFMVSSKALPRVLGKGGASINEIKDETGVSVDTSRDEDGDQVSVTLKGTRKGVQEAKQRILTIAQEVDNEARLTLTIPREYHTNLIGAGGSNIKEIMRRAGGPSDPRAAGQVVRFPGRDDTGDTVTITASKELAEKVKAEIEKEVSELKSRVVHGVVVPQAAHAALIGRGASNLQDLQRRHNIRVLMPGRNDHANAGEPVNKADLSSASADEIVKLVGSKDAVEAAAEEIVSKHKAAAPTAARFSITVEVPRKLHATIAQQGKFFRALPAGTRVSHDGHTPPSTSLQLNSESAETKTGAAQAARIDEATDDPANDLDAEDAEALGVSLKVLEMPGANEEGTIPWVIGSRTEQDAQRVKEQIEKALESAQSAQTDAATRCGLVTVPRSLMPRIIGRQGSGLEMLRTFDVQVEVVGRKDANQLTLIGLPDNIQKAYSSIVSLAKRPARSARD